MPVNDNMFNAGVSSDSILPAPSLMKLPLNLIALILSFLDNVGDLSRICQTCRVLHYMSLPQLYKSLTLTSYDKIRYNRNDIPEGHGSASPFSMGLNALVTRNVASLVRSFNLQGQWREDTLEEHAVVGRVPDSSMMLNITVRAAIDKMADLESFSWGLNTKLLETVYQGLSRLRRLESLSIRFPSSRHPRPTTVIPAMPNLRALKVTHIDPLCYPDDISVLLCDSKKLQELKMHWSPRMREAQESSVTLHQYFRKCIALKSPLRLKSLGFQNFYAPHSGDADSAIDNSSLEEMTLLTSGLETSTTTFVEASWPIAKSPFKKLKTLRCDRVEKRGCDFLGDMDPLENLYFMNPFRDQRDFINSLRTIEPYPMDSMTPASFDQGSASTPSEMGNQSQSSQLLAYQCSLRDSYMPVIMSTHGVRLTRLLLPSRWNLSASLIAKLVHAVPNLEQLGMATDIPNLDMLALLLPFLRKLQAIRILIPVTPYDSPGSVQSATVAASPISSQGSSASPGFNSQTPWYLNLPPSTARSIAELVNLDDAIHNEAITARMGDKNIFKNLKVLGFGWKAWELGEFYEISASEAIIPFNWEVTGLSLSSDIEIPAVDPVNSTYSSGMWPQLPVPSPKTTSISSLGKRKHGTQQPIRCPSPNTMNHLTNTPHLIPSTPSSTIQFQTLGFEPHPQPAQTPGIFPNSTSNPSNIPLANGSDLGNNLHSNFLGNRRAFIDRLAGQVSEETRQKLLECISVVPDPGNKTLWRRRVKRVGWDVLKHWEIWGQDSPEI
ncbi:hypothetical protein FQN57_001267 [Myotisia sp. PD_48]|nr:hypothetical protein FQN57_001267 [Myotisia sp. PD_48]